MADPIVLVVTELPIVAPIVAAIDSIITGDQLSLKIANCLLDHVFYGWNTPDNVIGEKSIRKYLVVDFYQLLCEKQGAYLTELQDYSKNADDHNLLQQKIKGIAALGLQLQKKEYHDEIIYYMNILS
jgi:hypothetical protein